MFSVMDLVLAMGFAWMISGICQLFISSRHISVPVWPSSLLIFTFGLTLLDNLLKPGMLPESLTIFLFTLSRNSYFLIGPFIWLYTRSLLSETKVSLPDVLHLFPFLITVLFTGLNPESLIPGDSPHSEALHRTLAAGPDFFRIMLSVVSRGIYCFLVFRLIRRHERSVVNYYSRLTLLNTLSWLYYLVIFYVFLFLLNFIILLIPPMNALVFLSTIVAFVRIAPSLLFIFLFSLFAQNQPVPEEKKLHNAAPSSVPQEAELPASDDRYRSTGMTSEESRRLYKRLNTGISENRLFLDSDLTLNRLAEWTGETRHHISEVINRESGENFYGYINGFRLREFLECVNENRYPHFTITAIALECGFKSNSAFYTLFKKKMGMTPKDYKKNASL